MCVTNFIYHSTLIGDWSATVFETQETNIQDFLAKNERKHLGKFCADAGLVGVFDLQEILNYDGNFAKFLEKDFLVAQINNFTGTVQIKVDYIDNDFVAYVEGKGNVNFYGIQTGF